MSAAANRMEAVWRQRADRLAQRPVAAGLSLSPVMILGIRGERYGVDLLDVAEVLPPIRITPVPGMADVFAGVVNAHGEIRPVMDLRRLLGIETPNTGLAGPEDFARVVLLRKDGREMGLRIDTVEEIRWIGPNDLQPGGTGDKGVSKYVKRSANGLLMLLDTEALFAELNTGAIT
jgi:chemotaxis signal transduction protein